jgi:hypothetical protein
MGMPKVNTRGIKNANKQMLMAATAYNLKKLLKFAKTPPKRVANSIKPGNLLGFIHKALYRLFLSQSTEPIFYL